jgi:hypothetical protein
MYIKELNLPKLPAELEAMVLEYKNPGPGYQWITANSDITDWCNQNICPTTHWGIQLINRNIAVHTDTYSQVKINYIVETGGDPVTNFYDNNNNLTDSIVCKPKTWYIMKTDQLHEVVNMNRHTRISVAGKIFP